MTARRDVVLERLRRLAEDAGIVFDPEMTFAEFALAIETRREKRDTEST